MPDTITSRRRNGAFVVSEANGYRSREQIMLAGGQGELEPGTVLAKLTADGSYVVYDNAGADGSETAAAVLKDRTDTTAGPARAVIFARDCEVNGHELVWKAGLDAASKTAGIADLAVTGIIVRT